MSVHSEVPYFEKYISDHEHKLEGLYFAKIDSSSILSGGSTMTEQEPLIQYSDLFLIRSIETNNDTNVKNTTVTKIKDNLSKITLSDKESNFFEAMNLKQNTITNNKYSIILEGKDPSKFITGNNTLKGKDPSKFITGTQLNNKLVYGGNRKSLKRRKSRNRTKRRQTGGIFNIDELGTIVIYKYQDPVIRMICEYIKLWDNLFYGINDDKKVAETFGPFRTGNNEVNTNTFDAQIVSFFKGGNKAEGSICRFGLGLISCCNDIRESFDKLNIKLTDFDLTEYNLIIETGDYKRKLKTKDMNGPFFKPAENFLLDQNDDKILYVKILQKSIDAIIKKSGRVEGPIIAGEQTKEYPPVNLLELLDKTNDTWLIRCERTHLSLSPCVHLGLGTLERVDKLLRYFNLVHYNKPLEFQSIAWLHTISHALDRLYCGHTHNNEKHKENNSAIFRQILDSFNLFYKNMHSPNLIGIFPKDLPNINKLFYYIMVKDIDALEKFILSSNEAIINRMVARASNYPLSMNFSGAKLNSKRTILINKMKEIINENTYFDIGYSYEKDGVDKYIQKGCDIKQQYGCKKEVLRDELLFLKNLD